MTTTPDPDRYQLSAEQLDGVPEHLRAACAGAFADGVHAAESAASWTVDGNSSADHVRRMLDMIDAGDPESDSHLPAYPDLSGEMADGPTPASIAAEHLPDGVDPGDPYGLGTVSDLLAEHWENGVSSAFMSACERELRAILPEPDDAETDGAGETA